MVIDEVQCCERNRERVRKKDEIFYFGEGEKAKWWDGGKLEGICEIGRAHV